MENIILKKVYDAKKYCVTKTGEIKNPLGFKEKTFDDFLNWFNQTEFDKGCHYCGTTNKRCAELYKLRPKATRGGKRGRRLELDRVDPFGAYDNINNLVWCCYWCNNAKSNFFTATEFKGIASAIGVALRDIKN